MGRPLSREHCGLLIVACGLGRRKQAVNVRKLPPAFPLVKITQVEELAE
jgi:hypothetical protein